MRGEHGACQGAREWDAIEECRGEVPVVKNKSRPQIPGTTSSTLYILSNSFLDPKAMYFHGINL